MQQVLPFLLLMVPSTFFLGLYDVLIRKILRQGVNEGILLGTVLVCSGITLGIISALVGLPEIKPGFWIAFVLTAALNTFSQLVWYKAFKREDASLISPLRLLTPPLVLLSGFFVLNETPTFWGAVGVLITVVGLWFLLQSEAVFKQISFGMVIRKPGVLFGLAGAVGFAISFPFDKAAILNSSALFFSAFAYLVIGLANLAIVFVMNDTGPANLIKGLMPVKKELPFFILFHTLGGFLAFQALNYALAAYAASVKRLWSLWAVILSGKILEEQNIFKKTIASLLMLGGIALTVFLG